MAAVLTIGGCSSDGRDDVSDYSSAPPSGQPAPSDGQSSPSIDDLDVCALFTAEDFEAVTGAIPSGEPRSLEEGKAALGSCSYIDESGSRSVQVAAWRTSSGGFDLKPAGEPVEDLDARAYWDEQTGLLVVIDSAEDWYLQVSASGEGNDRARSTKAARLILEKL